MSKPCFRCRQTGSMVCEGHCGLCEDQETGPDGQNIQDGKPSERMMDETD